MRDGPKTIALTDGGPSGIGPEIAVKAAASLVGNENIDVVLVGQGHIPVKLLAGRTASAISTSVQFGPSASAFKRTWARRTFCADTRRIDLRNCFMYTHGASKGG